ncbi:MAG: CocE/NonD family hydrolase [Gemmatimonadota bacterium]|nr:MAG: CocE/NonD family hydrolase [Gemmatimonadota bacterium]
MRRLLPKIAVGVLALLVVTVVYIWLAIASVGLPGEVILATGSARNVSQYVEMRDGVRLAVDVWFPESHQTEEQLPTVMRATRYWRAQQIGFLTRAQMRFGDAEPQDAVSPEIQAFNDAGYAVVLVDVRGSGASFGTRPVEFGREEAEDLGEVAGWIARQPWSNGRVGTWGVSYEGNTAAMAAAPANPAITAIAPQYADFDAWSQLLWPGGVFAKGFIDDWGELVGYLDEGDICKLAGVSGRSQCTVLKLATKGVKRVDGSDAERLYEAALEEHNTPDIAHGAREAQYRNSRFGESDQTISDLSISGYKEGIERSGAAIFSWAGWMDGGTVDGALALFSTFSNPVRLVIGPWSHGGGHHTDPFLPDTAPTEPSSAEQHQMLLDFFDHYVRNAANARGEGVGEIRYFTFNRGWNTTTSWPPEGMTPVRWYLGDGGTLTRDRPTVTDAADRYAVDYTHTTGDKTRWHTQLGGGDVIYGDRSAEGAKLLVYTTEPLQSDVAITGAIELDLYVASTHEDGAFFGYLELMDPDGTVRYVTEGQLRAIHRKLCDEEPPYPVWGPCHTYEEDDAILLVPGEVARLRFGLFNTSVLVPAGHRIRIALAGHDSSVFDRYPAAGEPVWNVYRDRTRPSSVVIPMREIP